MRLSLAMTASGSSITALKSSIDAALAFLEPGDELVIAVGNPLGPALVSLVRARSASLPLSIIGPDSPIREGPRRMIALRPVPLGGTIPANGRLEAALSMVSAPFVMVIESGVPLPADLRTRLKTVMSAPAVEAGVAWDGAVLLRRSALAALRPLSNFPEGDGVAVLAYLARLRLWGFADLTPPQVHSPVERHLRLWALVAAETTGGASGNGTPRAAALGAYLRTMSADIDATMTGLCSLDPWASVPQLTALTRASLDEIRALAPGSATARALLELAEVPSWRSALAWQAASHAGNAPYADRSPSLTQAHRLWGSLRAEAAEH